MRVCETRSSSPCTAAATVGEPLVVHHKRLDLVFRKLGIFGVDLSLQFFLCGSKPDFGVHLLVEQRNVFFESLALVGEVRVLADLLEPGLHALWR